MTSINALQNSLYFISLVLELNVYLTLSILQVSVPTTSTDTVAVFSILCLF